MSDKSDIVERRRFKRYLVQDGVVAVPISSTIKIGKIMDISKGGISVRYVDDEVWQSNTFELDILLADDDFYLPKVPIKATVSDFEVEKDIPFSFITERQCGLEFGNLSEEQLSLLNDFIVNHTTGEA